MLQEARSNGARMILIATDGVFSMDGTVAPLKYEKCDLLFNTLFQYRKGDLSGKKFSREFTFAVEAI